MTATQLDGDIREHAAHYLAGKLSREEFEEWFVAATWDDRTRLATQIDHLLAEAAVLGEHFDDELRTVVTTTWLGVELYTTASAMVTTREPALEVVRTKTIFVTRPSAYAGT